MAKTSKKKAEEKEEESKISEETAPKKAEVPKYEFYKIMPMMNLHNRINAYKNMINPNMSGMGSSDKAVNIERANFVKHLEAIHGNFAEYFRK